MIIEQDKSKVERYGGEGEEIQFSILSDPKAFAILISKLYNNKPEAIIRELSCNAADSHVEAGKEDEPFTVHLPNSLEPYFSIRDYGVGLSHEDMMGLYATFFQSTKTGSNAVTGAFGLGSKTPLAYTKQFTVISRFDGMKRTYSAFFNEEQIPSFRCMNTEETDSHNGLEVFFAVREEDFRAFRTEAARALIWFKTLPTITGAEVKFDTSKPLMEGNNWKMYSDRESVALQGNVAYPIKSIAFENSDDENMSRYAALRQIGVQLQFDIGEVNVTANRQDLEYDKRTCANIIAKFASVADEIDAEVEKLFTGCKTHWDASILYQSITYYGGEYRCLKNYLSNTKVKYDGEVIKTDKFRLAAADNFKVYEVTGSNRARRLRGYNDDVSITANESTTIVYDDVGRGARSRLNYHIEETLNTGTKFLLMTNCDDYGSEKKIQDDLGNPPKWIRVSDLPKRPIAKGGGANSVGPHDGIFTFDTQHPKVRSKRAYWTALLVNLADADGYYVDIKRYSPMFNGEKLDDINPMYWNSARHGSHDKFQALLGCLLKNAKYYGFDTSKPIIGLTRAHSKEDIKKNPKLVNLFDFVKQALVNAVDTYSLKQTKVDMLMLESIHQEATFNIETYTKVAIRALVKDPNSLYLKMAELVQRANPHVDVLRNVEVVAGYVGMDGLANSSLPATFGNVTGLMQKIRQRYTMLWYMHPGDKESIADAAAYINLVDKTC